MCIRDSHFTGDMHAITTANNLISACLDNHIHQGNALDIDIHHVTWKRCMDMNCLLYTSVSEHKRKPIPMFPREQ